MTSGPLHPVLQYLRRTAAQVHPEFASDLQLLSQFIQHRDEAAFSALVHRHGGLVLGVCRRVLGDIHEAEDAFQATFLVLAHKAASVKKPELLGPWLYGVALRTALKARGHLAQRRLREMPLMDLPSTSQPDYREVTNVLDEELRRLPDRYRIPIVLCYLEGKSHEQAAKELGCPRETISTRMARARKRLKTRLLRRGVDPLSAGSVLLSEKIASMAVPPALAESTVQAGIAFAAGVPAAGLVSTPVFLLTKEVIRSMMIAKCVYPSVVAVTLGVLATGTGLVWQAASAGGAADDQSDVPKSALIQQQGDKQKSDKAKGGKAKPAGQPKPAEGKIISGVRARQWREKLDQSANIEFEPNTPLREALNSLSQRFNLTFLIDDEAFKADVGEPDIENKPVKLPRLPDIRLRTALRTVLQQVGGDFYTKDDVLFVVPRERITSGMILRQPVDINFDKRPLAEALPELSDMTGISIVLDVAKMQNLQNPKPELTADFHNVSLESAVRVLANMADMKSVVMDNLIYVTSVENADRLEEERAVKQGMAPAKWEKEMPPKNQ